MKKWVVLKEGWILRPTQDGLELITPERNITLEFSGSESDRNNLVSILLGLREIPARVDGKEIQEMLKNLVTQGVLRLSKERPTAQTNVSQIAQALWNLRKNTVGSQSPVHTVYWLDPAQSRFSSILSQLFIAKYAEITGQEDNTTIEWAFGTDEDRDLAELKAIMEGLERHASGIIPFTELVKSSARKLGKSVIDPRRVVAYTKRQYRNDLPLVPFSKDRDYYWKAVITFPKGEQRYLPVECLYYPVDSKLIPQPYTFANSSGVAAGFSLEDALLRGLYEAIERDAFMVVWLNRIVMPTIQINSLPSNQQQRIKEIEELGYQVHITNLTLDLTPVVLAVAVNHQQKPALVLGAASRSNVVQASSKAITEVEQQLHWSLRTSNRIHTLSNPKEVRSVSDHSALYASHKHLSKASFLWKGRAQLLEDTIPASHSELETLLELLKEQEKEVVIADLTPLFLKEIGVWVIRVMPLGLIPISFGYGMEPLGMSRVNELTIEGKPWPDKKPFTHPFS